MKDLTRNQLLAVLGLTIVAVVTLLYFASKEPPTRPRNTLGNSANKAENLNTAMGEFRRPDAQVDVTRGFHYLNQWADLGGTDIKDWQPPPLTNDFPPGMSDMLKQADLQRKIFPLSDYMQLREAIWCREIARWVSQQQPPERFQPWLSEVGKQQGVDLQEQLKVSLLLFDWSVRNIRLEPLLPPPPPPMATAGNDESAFPAAWRGKPGPGYSRLASQVLMYSRGDAYQRGWVFLLLARQAGIPGVMLGLEPENHVGEPLPWCPAVLIGGELYLFESELGLPFTNEAGTQIATWKELKANPQWLRRYDLDDIANYKVTEKDLQRVVPLIVATPEDLSSRMLALERSLKGEHHLQLTVPVRDLVTALTKIDGLGHARLWHVPWEAQAYQGRVIADRKVNEIAKAEYVTRYSVYDNPTPLYFGRQKHLRGEFESKDQTPGARELYMESRPSDRDLDSLALQSHEQAQLLQHVKEDASFFFALTHYETGNYKIATEWFGDRIMDGAKDSPWVAAARYNLARCYEAEGKLEEARDLLFKDTDSPQRQGNILRAMLLKKMAGTKDQQSPDPKE